MDNPTCLVKVIHFKNSDGISVSCPYNPKFVAIAREIGGWWLKRDRIWSFGMDRLGIVVDLCRDCFGYSSVDIEPALEKDYREITMFRHKAGLTRKK